MKQTKLIYGTVENCMTHDDYYVVSFKEGGIHRTSTDATNLIGKLVGFDTHGSVWVKGEH